MLWQVVFRLHKCNANETTNAKANTKLVATAAKSSLKTWIFAFFFSGHRDYSNSLTLSNVGELSWCWIPKNGSAISQFRKRKKMLSLLVYVVRKTLNEAFLLVAVLRQKNACCTCKVVTTLHVQHAFWLFCSLNLWHLWRSPLPSLVCSWKGPLMILKQYTTLQDWSWRKQD